MNFKYLFLLKNGRIGRQAFWIGLITLWVIGVVVQTVFQKAGIISISPEGIPNFGFWALNSIVSLAFVWPAICVGSKRCHDRNKSGWWMLLLMIPLFGFLWYLIECGCLKGTDGDNRYGPDPLGK